MYFDEILMTEGAKEDQNIYLLVSIIDESS